LLNWVIKAVYRSGKIYLTTNDARDWENEGQDLSSVRLVRLDVSGFPAVPLVEIDRAFGGRSSIDDAPTTRAYYGWAAVQVNKYGDMGIVYARTASDFYPEVRMSAYYASENDIRPSRLLKAGEIQYGDGLTPAANGSVAWADLGGASVDPFRGEGIWLTQQYAANTTRNNNYSLWVGKLFGSAWPELTVDSVEPLESEVDLGASLTVLAGIFNAGDGAATTRQRLYLTDDPGLPYLLQTQVDEYDLTINAGTLSVNQRSLVMNNPGLTPGTYWISAVTDAQFSNNEYDETNNYLVSSSSFELRHPTSTPDGLASGPGFLARPNPSSGRVSLSFRLDHAAAVRVEIFDLRGRRVRSLFSGTHQPGPQELFWDGRDDAGFPVASGVFLSRLRIDNRSHIQKLVRVAG